MGFKFGRFFYLLFSFIIGSFLFLLGGLSLFLSGSSLWREKLTQFIYENPLILALFGIGIILTGLSLLFYTYLQTRFKVAVVKKGDFSVQIEENVIRHYLENYWQNRFPEAQVPFYLTFKKHSLQIVAHLPPITKEEQKSFLEEVKKDFTDIFKQLGYPYDVQLIAKFQTAKS